MLSYQHDVLDLFEAHRVGYPVLGRSNEWWQRVDKYQRIAGKFAFPTEWLGF